AKPCTPRTLHPVCLVPHDGELYYDGHQHLSKDRRRIFHLFLLKPRQHRPLDPLLRFEYRNVNQYLNTSLLPHATEIQSMTKAEQISFHPTQFSLKTFLSWIGQM